MTRKTGSVKRGIVASDLLEERAKCNFDQNELAEVLHGGPERLAAWKNVIDLFGNDPALANNFEFNDMTPHEMQENLWKRINVLVTKHHDRFFVKPFIATPYIDWISYFQGLLPGIGLQISMFRMSVENLANDEQKARWMPKITGLDFLGCYCQTEIGHGSNVAGIETTATLDMATDEFVIHTPSITATKYWPGDLGRFTSHCIVFARCIAGENDYGVQPFMVQIRDVETWKIRDGVKCGDLGPKIGYNSKDNGWCSFDKIRIPRTDMLMGMCEVDKQGDFSIKGDVRVLYTTMMGIRMLIVQAVGMAGTMLAAQKAIRYCCIRRQFSTQQGTKEERKVIDYQTCSFTMAKLLARGVTMNMAGVWVQEEFRRMMSDVHNRVFSRMDVNHHILSGFKSLFTYLNEMQATLGMRNMARTVDDFLNLDLLDKALQARACNLIASTMRDYNASTAPSKVKDNDLFYQAKSTMTKAHLKYLQFFLFRHKVQECQIRDPNNAKVLELIGKTWALQDLIEDGSAAYDSGFFAAGSLRAMQQALEQCVAEMRPQFVAIAETPYFPDHCVPSAIGNSFGDIYEQQLETAQNSRLNINNEVPEYFERLMKPILQAKL